MFLFVLCQDNVGQIDHLHDLKPLLDLVLYVFGISLLSTSHYHIVVIPFSANTFKIFLFEEIHFIPAFGSLFMYWWFTKMSKFEGVIVSDQLLQSQFTQVELRSLKSKVSSFLSFLIQRTFWSNFMFCMCYFFLPMLLFFVVV